jgi:hypothetical protein
VFLLYRQPLFLIFLHQVCLDSGVPCAISGTATVTRSADARLPVSTILPLFVDPICSNITVVAGSSPLIEFNNLLDVTNGLRQVIEIC